MPTLTTVTMPLRTAEAILKNGAVIDCYPVNASTGSRNPNCESSESGQADASVLRDEAAIRRLQYALSPEALYLSALKCFHGTDWKSSVAAFELNVSEKCLNLSDELIQGIYIPRTPKRFELTRPKRRPCLSIGIRDRVYQKSLCDNIIYPVMSKALIPANCACQKNKGTDTARARLVKMLKRHYHHYGTIGWVLEMDIAGYYPNMQHGVANNTLERYLDPYTFARVKNILSFQYSGDTGFDPGSQLVQIVGISVLNGLDHFIKEQLHVRGYIRYMDDMVCLSNSREELERVLSEVTTYLGSIGMHLHPTKTRIQKITYRVPWLGFTYELKDTGYVVVRAKPAKIRDSHRRFRRLIKAVSHGTITIEKANEIAWNTIRYLRRNCSCRADPIKMECYWKNLVKEAINNDLPISTDAVA